MKIFHRSSFRLIQINQLVLHQHLSIKDPIILVCSITIDSSNWRFNLLDITSQWCYINQTRSIIYGSIGSTILSKLSLLGCILSFPSKPYINYTLVSRWYVLYTVSHVSYLFVHHDSLITLSSLFDQSSLGYLRVIISSRRYSNETSRNE